MSETNDSGRTTKYVGKYFFIQTEDAEHGKKTYLRTFQTGELPVLHCLPKVKVCNHAKLPVMDLLQKFENVCEHVSFSNIRKFVACEFNVHANKESV